MSLGAIVSLMRGGIMHVFMLASPVLISALIIGLIVAIFQATTSIQEQTLTFLPKFLTILVVIGLLGGWMFSDTAQYFVSILNMIPSMAK